MMLSPVVEAALERRPPAREVGAVEGEAAADTPVRGVSLSESESARRGAIVLAI